jgi:hypothetical protein
VGHKNIDIVDFSCSLHQRQLLDVINRVLHMRLKIFIQLILMKRSRNLITFDNEF